MIVCNEFNYAFNSVYNKNNWFFSKMVDSIDTKMLKINVKYRIGKKTNDYSVDF